MSAPDNKIFDFGKGLVKNTFSNYFSTVVKMVSAIFLTRLLLHGLGEEFYGFWSLLWGVFMFTLVLDFGFGKAVEKYTAEASFSGDMKKFNSIISTIVFAYSIMALLVLGIGYSLSFILEHILTLKNGTEMHTPEYYRLVFLFFTGGIALVFPTGVFPTILVGLQRAYLRNHVIIANKLIELAGVWYLFHSGYSLLSLAIFTASINLLSNMVMAIMAYHFMPGLQVSVKNIKLKTLKYISDFSLFTYIMTLCDLIIFNTDPILIAIMLQLPSIAIYQIAKKIPQLISTASTQFQTNLAPIAAILHKSGNKSQLQKTLFDSTRITVFICTGVFIVFIPLVRPILYLWLKVTDETTIALSYILITSTYTSIVFRDTAKHFLLMTGYHRFLTKVAIFESISNIVLSIILVKYIGVVGVAWGTLIPNLFISLFIIFPVAARQSGNSTLRYMTKVYLPIILFAAPIALVASYVSHSIPLEKWTIPGLFMIAPATGILYLLTGWLIYVNHEDKVKLCSFLPGFVPEKLIAIITR